MNEPNSLPQNADLTAAEDGQAAAPKQKRAPLRLPHLGKEPFFRRASFRDRRYLGLCFLFPALLLFLIYALRGVWPFGEGSILILDMNAQYVDFFAALRRAVLDGGSLVYSFARNLSGEFMGIYAYYLASPFSWLVLLFPATHITEALLLIFVLKAGACGLTFGIYMEVTRKRNPSATVMFSVMYALCSYAVVMQHNTMWIDELILLPLLTLGIEQVIRERKYKLFVISLSMALLANFYIGYMLCIFTALYSLYYYYANDEASRNPTGERHHLLFSVLRMFCVGLLSICIAMVIILPTYTSLQFGKSTFSDTIWNFSQNFDFLDLITKLFFGSYDTVRPEGLPFLFTGTLTLLLVPLYFIAPHIKTREKIASLALICVFVFSFNVGALDIIWHGFQRPNWLNYRYAFILCFFLLVLAFKAFEQLREIGYRRVLGVGAVLALVLIVIQKFDEYKTFWNGTKTLTWIGDLGTIWASLAFIVMLVLILRGVTWHTEIVRRSASLVLVLAVMMEMGFSTAYDLNKLGIDVIFSTRTQYANFIERLQPAVDSVLEYDTSFYRFEKTVHRMTNDNMSLGIRGLSNSTSTLNASALRFLRLMGMNAASHKSQYKGATPALDALTGIRYLITDADNPTSNLYEPLWTVVAEAQANDLTVYRNPYALPLAFGVSELLMGQDVVADTTLDADGNVQSTTTVFEEYASPFERTAELLRAMAGDSSAAAVYRSVTVSTTTTSNVTTSYRVGNLKAYTRKETGAEASVTYQLAVDSTDPICFYLACGVYPRECKVYVNNTEKAVACKGGSNYTLELGSYQPGDTVTVRLVLTGNEVYIKNNAPLFYYFDEAAFKNTVSAIGAASPLEISDWSETHFTGHISVEPDKTLIFTSLPYDSGWKITCDGQPVETFQVLGTFVAYKLTPGEHTVEMTYRPTCLVLGGIISVCGILGFACLWTGEWLINRKKRRVTVAAGDLPVEPDPDAFAKAEESAKGEPLPAAEDAADMTATMPDPPAPDGKDA